MLYRFAFRSADRDKAINLYGAVVTQARNPALFTRFSVSDTPQGRYEMLVLHLVMVLERLRAAGPAAGTMGRDLVEVFVSDMDDNMREMGVGDLSVPRRVQRAAGGLYDRALGYRVALAEETPKKLIDHLRAYVFDGDDAEGHADALAAYVLNSHRQLAEADVATLRAAQPVFASVPHVPGGAT